MAGDPWVFRSFRKDKIRFLERYHHNSNQTEIPRSVLSNDALILIPDGPFIRKYLRFFEELLLQHSSLNHKNTSALILLESAAEVMDHRYNSPSILLDDDTLQTESTANNERKRIVKLWNDHKVHTEREGSNVISFADLSLRADNDEFDLFHYETMAVKDRSRCALVRASQMITKMATYNGARILLLSDDTLLLESNSNESGDLGQTMNCESFISFLVNQSLNIAQTEKDFLVEHWQNIKKSCEEDHKSRNKVKDHNSTAVETDKLCHFEYLSDKKLEEGISQKIFFQGVLKVTNANSKEAYCSVRSPNGSKIDYYLNEMNGHFNRAIHEDNVIIEPLPKDLWEQPIGRRRLVHTNASEEEETSVVVLEKENVVPTAHVVGFSCTKRQRRKYVATMLSIAGELRREENNVLVVPMDMKIPRIRIKTRISHEMLENKRLLVEIDHWNVGSSNPTGHFVQILGDVGDLDTEIDCLLREHCIDLSPFSANALACLPGDRWKIDNEEIGQRRDLRNTCRIFSVDPAGCQDIDDAMHAKELSNGDIEVGVHIADVTHFLKHKSALDIEASRRATTFYLVDRRFDMLPSLLSSDLCSLHGKIDRLAVSVIWTFSSDLETIKSTWYGRTVIHNVQAMTYEQAHNILHDKDPEGKNYTVPPPLTAGEAVDKKQIRGFKNDLAILTKLTRKLKKRREIYGGAVDLSSGDRGSELKFVLDDFGNPTKVVPKKELEIHNTIAELMIMANGFVAGTIYKHFPDTALLRIHGSAKVENFDELESLLKASGSSFDGKSNKALAQSLNDARAKGLGSIQDNLFQSLATRAMSEAQYVCTGSFDGDGTFSHYGLGIELYTHFTSPIRRYADVIVHRLLLESLKDRNQRIDHNSIKQAANLEEISSIIPESNALSVLNGERTKAVNETNEEEDDSDEFLDSLIEGAEDLVLGSAASEEKESESTGKQYPTDTVFARDLYQTTELSKTCDILNSQNRISKLSSMQCQQLFLSLYFRQNIEETEAIVIGLRQNGLIVYAPKFDLKGPIFLADKNGNINIDPKLLRMSSSSGLPPSLIFSSIGGYRMFPDGRLSLRDEHDESKAKLVLNIGKESQSFQRLDVITVRLSCDLSNTIARVPPLSIHLVSLGRTSGSPGAELPKLKATTVNDSKMNARRPDKPSTVSEGVPEQKSIFSVLSSIPTNAALLHNVNFRFDTDKRRKKVKDRVQTIKGRIYMNGYNKEKLQPDSIIDTSQYDSQMSLTAQAATGDYDASKRIEREATARMQRKAAERQNSKRSKAMKRK